jgi:tRNA G18 (ribose-2'-O)-methylase SpoU
VRPEPIEGPDDARIADYRDLRDQTLRDRRGLFAVEGGMIVRRLLAGSRFRTRSVLATARGALALRGAPDVRPVDVPLYVASAAVIAEVVGYPFHRGCVAVAERGPGLPAPALVDAPGTRVLVVLDELADPDNVGAVFRNALAFGVDAALLSPGTVDPLYRKAIRVSAGATLRLPFARVADWAAGLRRLREAGYAVLALTPEAGAVAIDAVADGGRPHARFALAIGAEGHGLRPTTRAAATLAVRIPMAPGVDSLNVATATGIALHRLLTGRWRDGAQAP